MRVAKFDNGRMRAFPSMYDIHEKEKSGLESDVGWLLLLGESCREGKREGGR